MKCRFFLKSVTSALAGLLIGGAAIADDFPNKSIRLVVPFAAGGNTDIVGRLLAQGLSQELRQTVFVDNKVGAGTIIGTEEVARSKPDGYTLLMTTVSFAINPSIYKSMRYDSKNDFAPIAWVSSSVPVLVVHPSVPATNIPQLIAYIKKSPQASFGSAGIGSAMHMDGELFLSQTGVKATHVPYRGEAPAVIDMLAGRHTFLFPGISTSIQYIKSGALKAIAVPSLKRSPLLPDVPTAAEAGLPGFLTQNWAVVLAPAGTPRDILNKLNAAINRVSVNPEIHAKLVALGFEPIVDSTPASTAQHIAAETSKLEAIVKRAGITAD